MEVEEGPVAGTVPPGAWRPHWRKNVPKVLFWSFQSQRMQRGIF